MSPRYSDSNPPSGAWSDEAQELAISPWVQWVLDMDPEERRALIADWQADGLLERPPGGEQLAEGAREFADEDRAIAESTMAAKIDALNQADWLDGVRKAHPHGEER